MAKIHARPVILASKSPRRAELLERIGIRFEVRPSHFDESQIAETNPARHVIELSLAKANAVAQEVESGLVIGADTIVVLDDRILGKPGSGQEAFDMLSSLAGRTHQVHTGFAIIQMPEHRIVTGSEVTQVHFRELADWEIWGYIESNGPFDKAGGYGIQDQSAVFADRIEGCFYNVVGFPLTRFYEKLLTLLNNGYEHREK